MVAWKNLAEIFLCKYEAHSYFRSCSGQEDLCDLTFLGTCFQMLWKGIGGCAGGLAPGWRSLCLLKTPSVGVYLADNEVGQAGEMKGAGTCVTRLTAALFELRCVKCSKSFAKGIASGCACRV